MKVYASLVYLSTTRSLGACILDQEIRNQLSWTLFCHFWGEYQSYLVVGLAAFA